MERRVVYLCGLAGFLGVLAAILGFAAEAKHIRPGDVTLTDNGTCIYPRSPALGLGLAAGIALMIAQVIINTAAGCICCQKRPRPSGSNWTIALVCFVVSWITFIIAFLLFLAGAALNDQHGEENMYYGYYCFVVKSGVFSGGAVLSVASVSLGIIYYIALSSSKTSATWGGNPNQGIALATPQVPPQSAQPAFVPEDTYNRLRYP
ncbi:unnamed protein product [Victoria cruziana]